MGAPTPRHATPRHATPRRAPLSWLLEVQAEGGTQTRWPRRRPRPQDRAKLDVFTLEQREASSVPGKLLQSGTVVPAVAPAPGKARRPTTGSCLGPPSASRTLNRSSRGGCQRRRATVLSWARVTVKEGPAQAPWSRGRADPRALPAEPAFPTAVTAGQAGAALGARRCEALRHTPTVTRHAGHPRHGPLGKPGPATALQRARGSGDGPARPPGPSGTREWPPGPGRAADRRATWAQFKLKAEPTRLRGTDTALAAPRRPS